jgi:hypothetical protein
MLRRSDETAELLSQKRVPQQEIQRFVAFARASLAKRPAIQGRGLAFDDDGPLWTQPSIETGRLAVLNVFAPDGSFQGNVTLDADVSLLSIGRRLVLTRAQLPDSRIELYIYRISR